MLLAACCCCKGAATKSISDRASSRNKFSSRGLRATLCRGRMWPFLLRVLLLWLAPHIVFVPCVICICAFVPGPKSMSQKHKTLSVICRFWYDRQDFLCHWRFLRASASVTSCQLLKRTRPMQSRCTAPPPAAAGSTSTRMQPRARYRSVHVRLASARIMCCTVPAPLDSRAGASD